MFKVLPKSPTRGEGFLTVESSRQIDRTPVTVTNDIITTSSTSCCCTTAISIIECYIFNRHIRWCPNNVIGKEVIATRVVRVANESTWLCIDKT